MVADAEAHGGIRPRPSSELDACGSKSRAQARTASRSIAAVVSFGACKAAAFRAAMSLSILPDQGWADRNALATVGVVDALQGRVMLSCKAIEGTGMAELIPDRLPSKATRGEERVFGLLQRLPGNCMAYYEPAIRSRHPDFVVMIPSLGVLLIEVKGWYAPRIVRADTREVVIQVGDRREVHRHPLRQARDYMFRLMDEARSHLVTSALLQGSGSRRGHFRFPFGHVVVLSNIRHEQLAKLPDRVFPASRVLTRDELDEFDDLASDELVHRLKKYFDPWWTFAPLDEEEVSLLRAVVHPEIVIERSENFAQMLKLLDLRQERHARAVRGGHRIVHGVAGSGKTVLLVARAKFLAEDRGNQVLVLCFNRGLADYLRRAFSGFRRVSVSTFHAWGTRQGIPFRKDESEDNYGGRLLAHLDAGKGDAGHFDSVLIDEAQDFSVSWFQCARRALKEPDDGDLLVVGDWGQSLYRRRAFTWAEAGIRARGRTIHARFDLDRNYRNTREILRIAAPFARAPRSDARGDEAGQVVSVEADAAVRSGPAPELITAEDRSAECAAVVRRVGDWLRDGLPTFAGARTMIGPTDIAVLYPRLPRALSGAMDRLVSSLAGVAAINWASGSSRLAGNRDAVSLRTIHSAKGLQWRAVIVLWADLLPMSQEPEHEQRDRSLLYVAMTRAEDVLVLTRSQGSPFTAEIDRQLRAAGSADREGSTRQ
jgi:hypothetical protein